VNSQQSARIKEKASPVTTTTREAHHETQPRNRDVPFVSIRHVSCTSYEDFVVRFSAAMVPVPTGGPGQFELSWRRP